MSHTMTSPQKEVLPGALKIFPLLFDEGRLNCVAYSEDGTLKHLKIIDRHKASRLRLNSWFRIRGLEKENSSVVFGKKANLSAFRDAKPDISDAILDEARDLLDSIQPKPISVIKSPETPELSRVSVKGKIVRMGEVTPRRNSRDGSHFSVQNYRIADSSATMRVTAFNTKDSLTMNDCYIIHNAKKKIFNGRHSIEMDDKAIAKKIEGDIPTSDDMSDDEGGAEAYMEGAVCGIQYGNTILYDACSNSICRKRVGGDGKCPNGCGAPTQKAVTATVDLEYSHNGKKEDVAAQVFTDELNQLQGKLCGEFANEEEFENSFELRCPIQVKFSLITQRDGKKRLAKVSQWNHFLMMFKSLFG